MKKLLSITILTLTLLLSGCSEETKLDDTLIYKNCKYIDSALNYVICKDDGGIEYDITFNEYLISKGNQQTYYTQEEVDLMIQELEARIEELENPGDE